MSSYTMGMDDDTLDAINEILPEIQAQLKQEIVEEQQARMKESLEKVLLEIERQGEEEFNEALHDLQEESQKLKQQQTKVLKREIQKMRIQTEEKEKNHQAELSQKFMNLNFNDKILNHQRIQELEGVVMDQICLSYQQKFEATKNRKMKELAVKLESKEQKERKEKEKGIKVKVYASMGIQELKKDIEILKVGVASMRSQYNIKIKKIDTEIKEGKEKNKSLERYQENLVQLKLHLQDLKEERQKESNKKVEQPESKGISYLNSFSLDRDQLRERGDFDGRYLHEELVMESSDQEQQEEYSSSNETEFENPPRYEPEYDYQQGHEAALKNPILGFNIGALLRQEWQVDSLRKYMSNSTKENDSTLSNKNSTSNFQEKYHEQLKKMNGRKKLSQNSKNAIIKNLAMKKKKLY